MYPPPPPGLPSPPYPLSIKRASIEDLFNVSYWLWRLNPSSILPVMLSNAFEVLKQSVIVIALIYGLSQLTSAGVLITLAKAFQSLDFQLLVSTLSQIASQIIVIVAVSVGLFFIVSIIVGGFLNSAEYGSYLRVLHTGTLSIPDVLDEGRKRWVNMIWTVLLVEAIKNGPSILTIAWILFDISNLSSMGLLQIMNRFSLWVWIILLALIITAVLMLLTVYSYPAATTGFYGLAAVRKSIETCVKLPSNTIAYAFLRVASNILILGITFVASLMGVQVSSILVILTGFVIIPIFHIFKTGLFLKAQPDPAVAPLPVGPTILKDASQYIWRTGFEKTKKGFRELMSFLAEPRNIVFHILSTLIFSIGIILGGRTSSLGIRQVLYALGYSPGRVNPLFETYGLPFLALDISFHNWQISLATALSGIIFTVPTITTVIFNGFVLGVVEDIVQNLTMFLAAILPHGIIELPAFIIAGSAGLNLGVRFIKALKNKTSDSNSEFYKALRQAIYIILGLVPLFIIAGIIEAFITPYVMRFYGWG